MNSKKLFRILSIVFALLVVGLLVSVYIASNMLSSKSNELVDLKAEKQAGEQRELQLVQAKEDIKTYGELNVIAKSVVPKDKDQAKTVRDIVSLAAQSGIPNLSSVSFPPSSLGGTGQSSNDLTQVTPVSGIPGVHRLPITVTQSESEPIPYNNFITFLSKLEQNRRTAQVSNITVQPDADQSNMVSFTLVIDEFIKP